MNTLAYVVRRILQAILVVWLVSVLGFFSLKLSPGDCFTALLENPSTPRAVVAQLRARFNYDQPIPVQYGLWLGRALQGDLGVRCNGLSPVAPLIAERAGNTLLMSIVSLFTSWLVAIPLGIFCAVHQNQWLDRLIQTTSYTLQGFPSFILAILLLMFAQNSGLFPIGGLTSIDHSQLSWFGKVMDVAYHLVLPTLTLTLVGFAGLQRLMRGNLLDVLRQDYIRTARAKGLPEKRVIYVHALRNAVNPLITLLGFEFASLLSGAFLTEFFFNIPGLGRLMLSAINEKDVNLVMAGLMIGTIMLVLGNLLADLALKFVDPRIQLQDLD
ncbi:MAG: ABC transporter permease [Pseudanabaenaceae cyanobacterium]